MAEATQQESKKQDASFGFVAILVLVGAFIAFMMWVWNPTRMQEIHVEETGGSGGRGATPMVLMPPPPDEEAPAATPPQSETKEQTKVDLSHPQLLEPQVGAEMSSSEVSFKGVAQPGTEVTILADDKNVATGVVDEEGNFNILAKFVPPAPKAITLLFRNDKGEEIHKIDNLELKINLQ